MATETKRIGELTLLGDIAGTFFPVEAPDGKTYKASTEALLMNSTAYGVEIDNTVSNPLVKRVGNPLLHQHLPIQSKMRRCVVREDGTIAYYLDPNNSLLKQNGTVANLDGTDGDVLVEIPAHYARIDEIGTKETRWVSENQLQGFVFVPRHFVSAFEPTLDRVNYKLCSVINTTAQYRGGDNNASYDAGTNTLLGRPVTALTMAQARTYARNKGTAGLNGAGWNQYLRFIHEAIFNLYLIEYANRNSQAAFNSALDANGYRQGGLGDGVTGLVSAEWSTWNGQRPFVPCGHTVSLGNNTGVVPFTMPADYPTPTTVQVPSYRGIENPFGHTYTWLDGVKAVIQADDSGGRSIVYACDNPALINTNENLTNYKELCDIPRANGYAKEMNKGTGFPKSIGAGTTTYWCDYFYTSVPASGQSYRGLLLGGNAAAGAPAGLGLVHSYYSLSYSYTTIGFRLCFIPEGA